MEYWCLEHVAITLSCLSWCFVKSNLYPEVLLDEREKTENRLAIVIGWSNKLRGNCRTKHTFPDLQRSFAKPNCCSYKEPHSENLSGVALSLKLVECEHLRAQVSRVFQIPMRWVWLFSGSFQLCSHSCNFFEHCRTEAQWNFWLLHVNTLPNSSCRIMGLARSLTLILVMKESQS